MIKLITEPSVYLVGKQVVDDAELSLFLGDNEASGWTTDTDVAAEKLCEVAGRLCYQSYAKPRPGGNAAYLKHILEVGHGSVLEHAVYNLIIAGVSRSFSHELIRHRVGMSPSQLSQRFVDESECSFVVPPALLPHKAEFDAWRVEYAAFGADVRRRLSEGDIAWTGNPPSPSPRADLYRQWRDSTVDAQAVYRRLSDGLMEEFAHVEDKTARRKAAREAARSVLPSATETKIFVTGNARALRHFISMRADPAADAEMRRVAVAVLRVLQAASPNLFGDFVVDGDTAATAWPKV